MNWHETKLWEELERRIGPQASLAPSSELKRLVSFLTLNMEKIQTVLADGGTSRLDFTLHDSQHSFRVAERMVELIPADLLGKLCDYEIVLLLLSAYLHDIGMTPTQNKVLGLEELLLDGKTDKLDEHEKLEFSSWLDNANDAQLASVPAAPRALDTTAYARIRYTITHYARYRHNAWSSDWTRDTFSEQLPGGKRKPISLGDYEGWLDDLILLCESHHKGRTQLLESSFNPRLAGCSGAVVHLRFLALLLRMADILEFAPRRTPDVLLKHRVIDKRSLIYWRKDHVVTIRLERNQHNSLFIEARPSDARVHSAVETMIREIDHELATCRFVADASHIDRFQGSAEPLPHCWPWPSAAHSVVRPTNDDYVFMNGTFRPNTSKLLELLSGTQLWGSPLAALRELLQNGFDAVREQMAYERLSRHKDHQMPPCGQTWESFLGTNHQVSITIEQREGAVWLCCQDDGIGMNSSIIEDHFLVSGKPVRHQITQLERDCLDAGFELGRTGQFGIGVLSYFMLGDEIRLLTRRSAMAGDEDPNGWEFSHEGVGDWGQLRKAEWTKGTRIEIKLRDVTPDSIPTLASDWIEYLREVLVRIPCCFLFNVGNIQWRAGPGWTHDNEYWKTAILKKWTEHLVTNREHELHPVSVRKNFAADDEAWNDNLNKALSALNFSVSEHPLPSGLGFVRVIVPYFELNGEKSLIFPFVDDKGRIQAARARSGLLPNARIVTAWKGIGVSIEAHQFKGVYPLTISYGTGCAPNVMCDLDLHSGLAVGLSVDRKSLRLNEAASSVLVNELSELTRAVGHDLIESEPESEWHVLNGAILGVTTSINRDGLWPIKLSRESMPQLRRIVHPFVLEQDIEVSDENLPLELGRGNQLVILADWKQALESYSSVGNNSASSGYPKAFNRPTRIALSCRSNANKGHLVRVWDESADESFPPLFPPSWKRVVGAKFGDFQRILNFFCPLVQIGVKTEKKDAGDAAYNDPARLLHLLKHARSAQELASLLLTVIFTEPLNSSQVIHWNGIIEKHPGIAHKVWEAMSLPTDSSGTPQSLLFISRSYGSLSWQRGAGQTVMSFSPSGAEVLDQDCVWNELKDCCPADWLMSATP